MRPAGTRKPGTRPEGMRKPAGMRPGKPSGRCTRTSAGEPSFFEKTWISVGDRPAAATFAASWPAAAFGIKRSGVRGVSEESRFGDLGGGDGKGGRRDCAGWRGEAAARAGEGVAAAGEDARGGGGE